MFSNLLNASCLLAMLVALIGDIRSISCTVLSKKSLKLAPTSNSYSMALLDLLTNDGNSFMSIL